MYRVDHYVIVCAVKWIYSCNDLPQRNFTYMNSLDCHDTPAYAVQGMDSKQQENGTT